MIIGDWTPDIAKIANEMIDAYRYAETVEDGDQTTIRTIKTWQNLAEDQGDGFTDTHWLALVQELAQRCAQATPPFSANN